MLKFHCKICDTQFQAKGELKEWVDPSFGPCSKYVAKCPEHGTDCDEYAPPKQSKGSSVSADYAPPCASGGGCRGCELGL